MSDYLLRYIIYLRLNIQLLHYTDGTNSICYSQLSIKPLSDACMLHQLLILAVLGAKAPRFLVQSATHASASPAMAEIQH